MKQSKKLLSIFLAMLMLLGTVSVVANAAQQKVTRDGMVYDSIDNAVLTPEQVANTILDVLDQDVMPGLGTVDIYVGKLNLTSVDNALESVYDLLDGSIGTIASMVADVRTIRNARGNLNVQRSDGDLEVVYGLLNFIGDEGVSEVVSRIVWGIGTSKGITLGDAINGMLGSALDGINETVAYIPELIVDMAYDMLIYGSYDAQNRFNTDAADYKEANGFSEGNKYLPAGVQTLDDIANTAIRGLLTKPQKYTWEPTGATDPETGEPITTKVWDMSSYILDASKVEGMDLSLTGNSVFSILDKVIQIAYEDFGTVVLNHDVKKIFMEAMGVDFVRVTDENEEATIKRDADYIDVETAEEQIKENGSTSIDTSSVKNYFCNAQMWKVGDTWYFRDYVTTDVIDPATGEPKLDAEGNVETTKIHRYFRAEAYGADDLFDLVNWDYYLTGETMNFKTLINKNGSLIGSLNDLLNIFLNQALNLEGLNKILVANGENAISSVDAIWAPGGLDMFNENLMSLAGILLKNFTFMFFGRNPAYVDLNTLQATADFKATINGFVTNNDREGLIAYMLLPFLGDALPQLVYSTDMFESGKQIEQVAVLLVREFLSDLTPQINYDDQIFVDASLATGRKFQDKSSAQWINLLLNMGLDLAAVYLDNIANFNVDLDTLGDLHAIADGSNGKIQRWEVVLEEIVDWAVDYVADGTEYSVIAGLEPKTLGSARCVTGYDSDKNTRTGFNAGNYKGNAFDILSKALNTLLPLGLLCNVSSDAYALDVKMVFDRLIDVIDDFDLEVLLKTFGRNGRGDNLLGATNIVNQLLDNLVNRLIKALFGTALFTTNYTTSLNSAISRESLRDVVQHLLRGLCARKEALLRSALPVVAVFVDDWGSEQAIRTPDLSLENVTYASNGSLNTTVTIRNASRGLWRGYMKGDKREKDQQYSYEIVEITNAQTDAVSVSDASGTLAFGETDTFQIIGTIPATGLADRIDVSYQVYNEDGQLMDDGRVYQKSFFTYYAYGTEDWNHVNDKDYEHFVKKAVIFAVEADENGKLQATDEMKELGNKEYGKFYHEKSGNDKKYSFEPLAQPGNGFTAVASSGSELSKETDYWYKPVSFDANAYTPVDAATGAEYSFTYRAYSHWEELVWFSYEDRYSGWHESSTGGNTTLPTFYIKIYDTVSMEQLRELVELETSLNRRPEAYGADGDYMGWLGTLAEAITVAWNPGIDGSFRTDAGAVMARLEEAIAKLEAAKLTPAEQAAAGVVTVDSVIPDLETTLSSIEDGLGGKDYRTHMLYRWHRFQDARKDANRAIALSAEYNYGLPTAKFVHGSLPVYALNDAVKGDQTNDEYADYILALLQPLTEEEAAQTKANFNNVTREYGGYTTLDIAQISNLLTRMHSRLLPREGGVVNTYLVKEINAAKAEIGTTNTAGYSTRSWKAYSEALTYAESVKNSASQDTMFNAKYQLQVARNNLRLATAEADYTELQRLIGQAEYAINHLDQYKTETPAQKADIGGVLAALGYQPTSDGVTTKVFYDGAYDIINKSIDAHDQEDIDDVADKLKAALSKLEFKTYDAAADSVETKDVITSEKDENGEYITESIKTKLIKSEQNVEAVKALLNEKTGYTVAISLDDKYTSKDSQKYGFVGTGATITILKDVGNGVTAPVATIKVVVDGDVTGDGVVDVLDCAIAELAKNAHTELVGVYHTAGNSDGVAGISPADYSAIVNKAVS